MNFQDSRVEPRGTTEVTTMSNQLSRVNNWQHGCPLAPFGVCVVLTILLYGCGTCPVKQTRDYRLYEKRETVGLACGTCSHCGKYAQGYYCWNCRAKFTNALTVLRTDHVELLTRDPARLAEIAITDADSRVGSAAIEKLTDQKLLAEVARTSTDQYVRSLAIKKLTDQKLLAEIARTSTDQYVRNTAIEKLTDQKLLAEIATTSVNRYDRAMAIQRLTDQNVLARIAESDGDQNVRNVASTRLRIVKQK